MCPERYWRLPTFCWLDAGDGLLHFQCAAGTVLSLLLIAGFLPVLALVFLWAIYLSLSTVCRDFLSFQWDILLLETGFLAIFLAPRRWLPGFSRETAPSLTVLWLCRWLLFRLMFMSGAVKLLSGDATWSKLTALTFHYETQPLPTWVGWYAHQLPVWFQKTSVALMFVIELALPVLIFFGRRGRQIACGAFLLLMLLISLTGNYCFFNLLTVTLCVLLLDDAFLLRWAPAWMATFLSSRPRSAAELEVARFSFLSPRRRSGERTEERGVLTGDASSPRPSPPSDGGEGVAYVSARPLWEGSGAGPGKTIRAVGVGALASVILL